MFILLSGCVTLYKPNAICSPLLKEKGELNATAALGLSGCCLYNVQAAYAVTDHVGLMIDGMYHNRHYTSADSSEEKLNIFSGEAGAGYFTTFGEEKKGLFQCYGGVGYGNTIDRITNSPNSYPQVSAEYYNLFIQPGIAYTKPNFEIAGDVRMNYVNVYNIQANLYDKFEWWNTDFRYYSDTSLNFVNLEPTMTMKAGGKNLKGIVQCGVTIPVINSQSYFIVNSASMLGLPLFKFSVGMCYTFGRK